MEYLDQQSVEVGTSKFFVSCDYKSSNAGRPKSSQRLKLPETNNSGQMQTEIEEEAANLAGMLGIQ